MVRAQRSEPRYAVFHLQRSGGLGLDSLGAQPLFPLKNNVSSKLALPGIGIEACGAETSAAQARCTRARSYEWRTPANSADRSAFRSYRLEHQCQARRLNSAHIEPRYSQPGRPDILQLRSVAYGRDPALVMGAKYVYQQC